jgi:hypothetical protein
MRPSREVIERIAGEVAERRGLYAWEVLCGMGRADVVAARREALVLIIEETGVSKKVLADMWGLDRSDVYRAIRAHKARLAAEMREAA